VVHGSSRESKEKIQAKNIKKAIRIVRTSGNAAWGDCPLLSNWGKSGGKWDGGSDVEKINVGGKGFERKKRRT